MSAMSCPRPPGLEPSFLDIAKLTRNGWSAGLDDVRRTEAARSHSPSAMQIEVAWY
jgi:hypothetical protein